MLECRVFAESGFTLFFYSVFSDLFCYPLFWVGLSELGNVPQLILS